MEKVIEIVIKFRQQICPRTSYVTGGNAASTIACLKLAKNSHELEAILEGVIQRKEFEEVQYFPRYEDLLPIINQHVIIIIEDSELTSFDPRVIDLLKMKRTKLVFSFRLSSDDDNEQLQHQVVFKWSENEELCTISKTFSISNERKLRLQIWYFHKIYSTPLTAKQIHYPSIRLGFNKQPAVSSRLQFRFLWNLWPEQARSLLPCQEHANNLADNKRRVLQRIADRECISPGKDQSPCKYSTQQWDEWITQALLQNADDWDIYSLIRQKTVGNSLDKDTDPLSILLESSTFSQTTTESMPSSKVEINTQTNEERSDYLVDRIFTALPEIIQKTPQKYIHSFLDYGCAEGGMTTALGQKLQLSPPVIFGADIRTIPSREFQFLRLATEQRQSPPLIGTILPQLQNSQISLINASMVFHHVMHIDHALVELRRIIANDHGLLMIREHDCINAASAAFLDIVHGLYALSWQNPVEWPDFIEEAEAFYRSRSQWNELLLQYGFQLRHPQPPLYDQAERSTFNPKKQRYGNVVRAYGAIYIPKKDFPLMMYLSSTARIPSSNHITTTTTTTTTSTTTKTPLFTRSSSTDEPPIDSKKVKRSRSQMEGEEEDGITTAVRPEEDRISHPPDFNDYKILESKQYPGYYYKFFIYQDRSEWIVQ